MSKTPILVVDNEPDILELLSYNLEQEDYGSQQHATGIRLCSTPKVTGQIWSCWTL